MSAAEGKEQIDQLDPSEAAKLFEVTLASEWVEDNGQLAFKQLARSIVDPFFQDTWNAQGKFGSTRCEQNGCCFACCKYPHVEAVCYFDRHPVSGIAVSESWLMLTAGILDVQSSSKV